MSLVFCFWESLARGLIYLGNQAKPMNDKSCFIENDSDIEDEDKHYLLRTIWRANRNDNLDFDRLFDTVIVNAFQNRKEVWHAINECDYIFISTGFFGESAELLEDMCEMALIKKIKNKFIINFRDGDSHLQPTRRGARMLQILQARNNVKYISQDTEEFKNIVKKLFS